MYQIASKGYNLVRTKFDRNRIKFIIKRPKAKKIIRHISGRAGTPVRLDFSYLVATNFLTMEFDDHQFVSMVSRNGS